MINPHHANLMDTDIDATIAFWQKDFGAIVYDTRFAGGRIDVLRQVTARKACSPRKCPRRR